MNTAETESPRRIIVVGAGMAGVGVARPLVERGFEVLILEARDRIGGRCHTVDGIDLGAHWIHGTDGNPVTSLARRLNVDTLFVGGDSSYTGGWEQLTLHGTGGMTLTGDEKLRSILIADEVRDDMDMLRRQRLLTGDKDVSVEEAMHQVLGSRSLDTDDRRHVTWHITLSSRDDCAADLRTLSFLWWDDGYEVYGYGDSVFLHGYSALLEKAAAGLDIRLEHVVEGIQYDCAAGAPVRVRTNQGIFEADAVVVTLPLGILKAGVVKFEPSLPPRKAAAIERLGVGNLTKVTVRFESPFWPRNQYVFGAVSDPLEDRPTLVINLWRSHRIPALQFLVGGDKGREIERWTEDKLREWVMTVLNEAFGEQVMEPTEIACTSWDCDPFSLGSYSYIPVGATPNDMEILAEPVDGRLFFAGEATYRQHWATVHGAYASGLREAARIANDVSILPPRHFTENRRWREMMMRASRFFNVLSTTIEGSELEERIAVLNDSEVFAEVPANDLKVLAMMFEPVLFADGETICEAGDPATQVYVVVEGAIEVYLPDGAPLLTLRRGGVVGEYGMFGNKQRTATLKALGACRVLALDYQRFQRFLLAFPESALALWKRTVDQLMERNKGITLAHLVQPGTHDA